MISLITPTGDRPEAFELCARWMDRQTYKGQVQWIVVDDGGEGSAGRLPFYLPQWDIKYVRRSPSEPSVASFTNNLLAAIPHVVGDLVLIIEDDDWVAPTHLEEMARRLETAHAAGQNLKVYYHLPTRYGMAVLNPIPCLCATGFRRKWLPTFEQACRDAQRANKPDVDDRFWRAMPDAATLSFYTEPVTVVGMKGLPGRPGLGVGHRPDKFMGGPAWHHDPDLTRLRGWIGEDVALYGKMRLTPGRAEQ